MSQISSAAPLRTAKQLARQKEIRHVKSAIRWHERQRKQRQAIAADAFESKSTALSRIRWNIDHINKPKRRALMQARTDWKLGPLRPNRAVGSQADLYGVLQQPDLRRPEIPVRVQKNRNEFLERKGREVEYPLVVDDQKYFHIVKDDRVVVIRGREQGKIGVVNEVIKESHEVVIKDINKAYADSSVWNAPPGEIPEAKRQTDANISIDDVRLVVPYRIVSANGRETFQDVIVDKVIMERHITGIDPFTGVDYGNDEFPAEHRYDPETNLPIFKRYVAGTRSPIKWPWEKDEEIVKHLTTQAKSSGKESDRMSLKDKARHPIRYMKLVQAEKKEAAALAAANASKKLREDDIEVDFIRQELEATSTSTPKSEPLEPRLVDHEADTLRNISDPMEQTSRTYYPTLLYPPFPNQITDELAPHIREARWQDAKDKRESITQDIIERERLERDIEKNEKKMKALETMKTPLQLRWEVLREKQLKEKKKVDMDQLMAALGKHMIDNGVKVNKVKKVEEVE